MTKNERDLIELLKRGQQEASLDLYIAQSRTHVSKTEVTKYKRIMELEQQLIALLTS